jgi:hypothetical protein
MPLHVPPPERVRHPQPPSSAASLSSFTHLPRSHAKPLAHWLLETHGSVHSPPWQRYGEQFLVSPGPVSSVTPSARHFPADGTQLPVVGLQVNPSAQSSMPVQVSLQESAAQANGEQLTLSATQLPLPSHSETLASSPSQVGVPHA